MIGIVKQTNTSRKESEKKPGESHARGQTKEEVWLNRIFFFYHFFNLNLSLVGTEASPFGGTGAGAITSHA